MLFGSELYTHNVQSCKGISVMYMYLGFYPEVLGGGGCKTAVHNIMLDGGLTP